MDTIVARLKAVRIFTLLYISVFLLSFHYYFTYFINSSYLSTFASVRAIGYLYAAGAILNLLIFYNVPKILNRFGNYRLFLSLIFIEGLTLLGLALIKDVFFLFPIFIINISLYPIMVFNLDVFFESYSKNKETGGVRGMFLTMSNTPSILCTVIVGLLLTSPAFWKIYFISALFLIPLFYIIALNFKDFKDADYSKIDFKGTISALKKDADVRDIFIDNFLLNLFYGWMVIYMPIYLHVYIGFSFTEISLLFSIMLLPFLIFQKPLGTLADKKIGEKEILITGFVILIAAVFIIPFIEEKNFLLWAIVLFISRIGASFVEIASESYFFKHVSAKDINFISLFRMNREIPYIVVPVLVSICLLFINYRFSFIVLGIIMFLGLRYALPIKDTK